MVPDAPVELRLLRIENRGAQAARCRVVAYFEMVLAEVPLDSRGKLAVSRESAADALFFSNPDNDFVAGVAFVATSLANATSECLRARFVGGGGRDLSNPFFVEHGAPDVDAPRRRDPDRELRGRDRGAGRRRHDGPHRARAGAQRRARESS